MIKETTNTQCYDIIIIGGGPSAANFARMIGSTNKKILMIYNNNLSKPCGGLLSEDTQKVFKSYNIAIPNNILVNPQVKFVKVVDIETKKEKYYPRDYINVDRQKFDLWLLSLVPNNIQKVQGKCINIIKEKGCYNIRLLDGRIYQSTYLIGADGASSIVRKTFFSNNKIKKYMAIQQHFVTNNRNDFYTCIFDHKTSKICSWTIQKDDKLIYGGIFDTKKSRYFFNNQKLRCLEMNIIPNIKETLTEACLVFRPGWNNFCLGEETIFLIGEAAGFISPSSFEGISFALLSSEALANAFNSNKNIYLDYYHNTSHLRRKVRMRLLKCPFMYNYIMRKLVMISGITATKLKLKK